MEPIKARKPYSEWSEERKAKSRAYAKKWREANRDKKKEIDKKWREANKEHVKEYNKRRARIKAEKNIKPSLKTSDDLIWELD